MYPCVPIVQIKNDPNKIIPMYTMAIKVTKQLS